MKFLIYILSISLFFTSLPIPSLAQTGAGQDPFYDCKPKPTGDLERTENKAQFLKDQNKLKDDEIKKKTEELDQAKAELDAANKKIQSTDAYNRDTSVMDEKEKAAEKVKTIQKQLEELKKQQTIYAEDLKNTQNTLKAKKEAERLKNSTIEIFTLTESEMEKQAIAGPIAESNLQLMALATSAVDHLDCAPASTVTSASYEVFKGASAVYLTNNLSEVMDYENLAECVTKKALSPTERKDVQYALIKRARDLFNEMVAHVDSMTNTRGNDLELFNKALEYAMKEWAEKNKVVESNYAALITAQTNYDDAYDWWKGVLYTAIALSALAWFQWWLIPVIAGLWAWWGVELNPKKIKTFQALQKAKKDLRDAHQYAALKCNYMEAKRWNLVSEMQRFHDYMVARKKAQDAEEKEEEERIKLYKKQKYEEEQREESQEKGTTFFNLKPRKQIYGSNWASFFIDDIFAQDQKLLEDTVTKIEEEYQKSTSTEEMSGSMATIGDSKSRIPKFTPGTPQGNQVVEDLKKSFEDKKQEYETKKFFVEGLYKNLDGMLKDYNDYSKKYGEVAAGNPEITCSNEYPFPGYRLANANWDNTTEGKAWNEKWKTQGCTTENKATMELKQIQIHGYYSFIEPQQQILDNLELLMDLAETDFLTAQQINEGADTSDPFADKLSGETIAEKSYAEFLGKIKGEWKVQAFDVEKYNYILVDRTTNWTLEKLLNEHDDIKKLPAINKVGFSDAYTRYIYIQYAFDMVVKNLELLNRAKAMALGQAMAYQELLNEADAKLKLDAVALPTKPMLVKKQGCMKGAGAKISADPSCSCKIKGNCAKFSFPGAVLHGSSKDLSSGVISDYINQTYSGSEGARLSGDAVRRNAAATKQSIDEVKTTIVQQRKDMGFKNTQIENNSNLIASSIRADARRSAAAAIPTNTRSGRWARILALEEKTAPEKVAAAVAAVTSSTRAAQRIAKRKPAKPGEMEILSIEEGGTPTGEELEIGGIELSEMPKTKAKAEVGKAAPEEKPAGIEFDPSKTLWKIITKRYQNSAFPRLLKMKKVEK